MRIFSVVPAAADTEAGLPPDPKVIEQIGRLGAAGLARGVVLDQGGLAPSRFGARVAFTDGNALPLVAGVIEVRPMFDGESCAHADQARAAS